jgi:hypothetical protein
MTVLDKQRVADILSDRPGNYYATADENEREIFREWMAGVLRRETVTVDFEKTNGEFRSMVCTLQESQLPPPINKSTQKKANPEVCVVWDCNQNAWRSFRYDRIKRIAFTLG